MSKTPLAVAVSGGGFIAVLACQCLGLVPLTTLAEPSLGQPIIPPPTESAVPANVKTNQAALTADQVALTAANTDFAFGLLQQISVENPGANVFISPYSAATALEMVSLGAEGETLSQFQQTLGITNFETSALGKASKATAAIVRAKSSSFALSTANSVWYKRGLRVNPQFLKENESYFGARVEALNFLNPTAPHTINSWASQATHGEIKDVVSSPLDPALRMILANAVYFRGSWQTAFDPKQTTTQPFYAEGGGQASVSMMSHYGTYNYSTANGYQAIELPYKGGDLAMYVFLPGAGTNLQDFVNLMSGSWWQQTVPSTFAPMQGTIDLPKFSLNFSIGMIPALASMGITDAFSSEAADFSGITTTEHLYISQVNQQAVVDVDEKGTVAAAVTTVGVVAGVAPQPTQTFTMNVDRPFVFFIEDLQTKTVLFSGTVFKPGTAAN